MLTILDVVILIHSNKSLTNNKSIYTSLSPTTRYFPYNMRQNSFEYVVASFYTIKDLYINVLSVECLFDRNLMSLAFFTRLHFSSRQIFDFSSNGASLHLNCTKLIIDTVNDTNTFHIVIYLVALLILFILILYPSCSHLLLIYLTFKTTHKYELHFMLEISRQMLNNRWVTPNLITNQLPIHDYFHLVGLRHKLSGSFLVSHMTMLIVN